MKKLILSPDLGHFIHFNFTTAKVSYITAMINHVFISFSAVQMYDLSYIQLYSSLSMGIFRGFIKGWTPGKFARYEDNFVPPV